MTDKRSPALRFELDDNGDRLTAHFDPTLEAAIPPGPGEVLEALMDADLDGLYRREEAIAEFVQLAHSASMPVQLEIAERRDGTCRVVVASDAMSATLEVVPPFGGVQVERGAVDRALAASGVVHGLLEAAIQKTMAEASGQPCVVARGHVAEAGTPVQFVSLVPEAHPRGPSVDARGVADYRDLGTLVIVHLGDPLMRRVPSTPGCAGKNVLGEVIPAPEQEDTPYCASISGASPTSDDPNVLVADIAGQPVIHPQGVSVQPTIDVAAVDLSTGNIEFDGTVNIKGHVASGMRVVASGDVFVGGHVEAAHITAGGSLSVAAGAIGCVDVGGPGRGLKAELLAGDTVSVLFCEHVVVHAGGDVQVGEVALHSELTAGKRILIGKPGGRRSQLIGGIARCSVLLQVGTLGSSAAVHTGVEVGFNPRAYAQLSDVHKQIEDNTARRESLNQVLAYTEALADPHHVELRERARLTLNATNHQRDELLQLLQEAQTQVVLVEHARIVVQKAVHSNVDIRLGGKCLRTRESTDGRVYELHEGEIVPAP